MKAIYVIKLLITSAIIFSSSSLLSAKSPLSEPQSSQQKPQTLYLQDGTIITGSIISETNNQIIIMTRFGETTINKSDLINKKITVTLKSGDVIIGTIQSENETDIVVKTTYGLITLFKNDIIELSEGINSNPKPKKEKFTIAEDYLIDIFQDPTGNTLKADTVYISGLSLGYAFNDNFQISTRYDGFLYQNFNLRPKFRFLNLGNWEKQLTASAGFHIHSNWLLTDFHEYQKGVLDYCMDDNDPSTCYYTDTYIPLTQVDNASEYNSYDDEYMPMIEIFIASSYAKTRKNLNGRYQFTVGASAKYVEGANSYRAYAGFDVDLNKQLKLITEIIYDPYYDADKIVNAAQHKDFYIDLGAIYTFNNNLSLGMHMLPYHFTLYWKQ
ncbi:MAG: hypothetical protein HRU38_03585 [Saccharospirillaceae bacterium]|nr:hypothetical protein [Saccharospirillaceae bacterium]